ncbi:MAG: FIST N-terminal domain-containing protein [Pirellulales bacterium]
MSALEFAAALSTAADPRAAVEEACREVRDRLNGPIDLAVAFYSHRYGSAVAELPTLLNDALSPGVLLSCTGDSIVGGQREIEGAAALSVWAARLPGVSVTPLRLEFQRTLEGPSIAGWPDSLVGPWPTGSSLVVLSEPFSFPADWLLERLNADRPGVPVVGGMASGGHGPGQNRVALGKKSFVGGAVAVLLHGPLSVRTVVSQGCRPIGAPLVVTKAEQQWVQGLGGRKPLEIVQEIFAGLGDEDRALMQRGLHLGRVVNEYQEAFRPGDFLIRNCMGAERETGSIAVGEFLRPGQTVQFHIRDAASADREMRELLHAANASGSPQGGLLFTCNGRGTRLFEMPDHDAGLIQQQWPGLPLAGFFAQGELGPIGGKNFMHGFTASLALFGPPEA